MRDRFFFLFLLIGLLFVSQAFAIDSNNITTFSSFQVPNTSDQNSTLTCTQTGAGCKTINYNINNTGWIQTILTDINSNGLNSYWKLDETSGIVAIDSKGYDNNGTNSGANVNQTGIIGKAYSFDSGSSDNVAFTETTIKTLSFWIKLNSNNKGKSFFVGSSYTLENNSGDGTLEFYDGSSSKSTGKTIPFAGNWIHVVMVRNGSNYDFYFNGLYQASVASNEVKYNAMGRSGGLSFAGVMDEVSIWNISLTGEDINYLYNSGLGITYPFPASGTSINFLYNGAGQHSISYFSTDSSDNNETTKTSTFTTYGTGHFTFKDQNSGLDLNGVTVTSTVGDNTTTALNKFDTNFSSLGAINTQVTYTFTKTGYSTRYYSQDLNQFTDFNITFALLPNTIDVDVPFKVYKTDETTLYANTYVEVLDSDTNWTVGKLKTNSTGEVTFNLRSDDSNYNAIINNGQYTYTPVALTILYPKNEETLAQITEKWKIEITQNLYASYSDLNTNKIVYLLPNTSLPYNIKISDMNTNYFPRSYAKTYPGNPLTDTLQPYLVSETTGLLTTINAISATTNQPLENITFKVYKYISGLGRTYVEQLSTDSKGQALSLLVLGSDYEFEAYNGSILLKNFPITATSSTIFFILSLEDENITQTNPSGFSSNFTPGNVISLETIGNQGFSQTLYNFGNDTITISSTIKQNGVNLAAPQNYSGSSNKTFTYNVAWATIVKGTIIQQMVVTDSNGSVYTFTQNINVIESYGTGYNPIDGLQNGLRSDLTCSADPLVPCYPLLIIAFLISIAVTIWATLQFGVYGGQSSGFIFIIMTILFTYLTWIPVWVTAGLVLIMLAFIVNERR